MNPVRRNKPEDETGRLAAVPGPARSSFTAAISLLAAGLGLLCPLCIPALAALLVSLGAGAAAVERFVHPLLAALLLASIAMLAWSAWRHGRWWVVVTGAVGAVLIYTGRYVWLESLALNQAVLWTGAGVLVGSSILNCGFRGACRRCAAPVSREPGSGGNGGES